jgi:radical SAM protein with 4Fe4S-binding SPASM domain
MDLSLFKKIIDDAAKYDLESIDTCGFGECFLDKHLFERFAYVRKKLPKAQIYVSTTGYHMDPDTWDNVIEYIDILKLSIYGATRKTYEEFHRGKPKYNKTMDNIYGLLAVANGRPYTIGLFVTTDVNRHEKEIWIERWSRKLNEVFVWEPHNWVLGRHYRTVDTGRQESCGRPDNGPMYIHADGTVSPCCWDIHKEISLGSMQHQTIEEVYKGKPYRELRKAHREGNFKDYICQYCDQTNFDPTVVVFANNPERKVGQITSNKKDMV